jgi:hypothetical protein
MDIYRQTGDKKYLEPIPRALDYLAKSEVSPGRLARFYELKTNRPLYFTKQYELAYTADDLPTHYAFIIGSNVVSLRDEYEKLLATDSSRLKPARKAEDYQLTPALASSARAAIDSLDSRGAWVESGRLRASGQPVDRPTRVITTQTFVRNINTLSRFIAANKKQQ